jgi:Protein kinase domain/FHA domain/TIR domain
VVTRSADPRLVGRTFQLGTETIRIGRATDNDWSLLERSWSRRHAEIRYSNGGYVLCDLGSQNGTYVNGRRITETPLLFGSVIQIGALEITFSQMGDIALQDFTGCEIVGRYRLVKLLRDSPKGAVYEATDLRTSASVAIKLLSPALLQYPGYREQFQREARIAARLNHPYICRVADYGPATLTPAGRAPLRTEFLCFELMAGGSLVDRIEAKTAIPLPRVAEWLKAIADALEYAHRHQVFHGDLKPSAIVFDEEEHPYVTDFAIAQQVPSGDDRTMTGTPAYMAPELWSDGEVTPATEQFALAVITYYLVTGSRPFEGQDNLEVRQRNFRRGPPPAHEEAAHHERPDLPRAVSQVLARGLAADPARRYESLSAFATAFRASLRRIVHRAEGPEIFISYQRNVSAILAMYLADKLRAQGIHAFVDAQGLDGAGPFPPHIERAIEDADVFVCLLADTTLRAEWVLREIRLAQQYGKPMIPIMQESYSRGISASAEPAVAELLRHQGLLVLDKRNLHLEHTVTDLIRLIKSAISQRDQV